uniref:Protein root UVB sensitive/RUS domain-containing protein n=1 Tax=Glossina pallidipes TaxID=7398 RepID=A0A1A9ZNP2_GLOPL
MVEQPWTLCTHVVPKGLGLGNKNINTYSATVTWILKEASSHLGRILFSWWKGAYLDVESKKWRLRADFLTDCAIGIEIYVLSKYTHLSTYILCGTTVLKERRRLRHLDVDGRRRSVAPNCPRRSRKEKVKSNLEEKFKAAIDDKNDKHLLNDSIPETSVSSNQCKTETEDLDSYVKDIKARISNMENLLNEFH